MGHQAMPCVSSLQTVHGGLTLLDESSVSEVSSSCFVFVLKALAFLGNFSSVPLKLNSAGEAIGLQAMQASLFKNAEKLARLG